jgi:hypothetical protein
VGRHRRSRSKNGSVCNTVRQGAHGGQCGRRDRSPRKCILVPPYRRRTCSAARPPGFAFGIRIWRVICSRDVDRPRAAAATVARGGRVMIPRRVRGPTAGALALHVRCRTAPRTFDLLRAAAGAFASGGAAGMGGTQVSSSARAELTSLEPGQNRRSKRWAEDGPGPGGMTGHMSFSTTRALYAAAVCVRMAATGRLAPARRRLMESV